MAGVLFEAVLQGKEADRVERSSVFSWEIPDSQQTHPSISGLALENGSMSGDAVNDNLME